LHDRQLHHLHSTRPAPPHVSTLSLHDALPISSATSSSPATRTSRMGRSPEIPYGQSAACPSSFDWMVSDPARSELSANRTLDARDRKSTRLNSSHRTISYAVFCLKKKKKTH